jgi:thiol-disulfide isomerase/thioredoxin
MMKNKIVYSKAVSVIALIVFVYTFLPFMGNMSKAKEFTFDHASNEGYVAYIVNDYEPETKPDDDTVEDCPCDGSGKITHGDGHQTPCPCLIEGSDCKCKSLSKNDPGPLKDAIVSGPIVDDVDKSKEEIMAMVSEASDIRDETSDDIRNEVHDMSDEVKEAVKYIEEIISEPIKNWDIPKEGIDPADMVDESDIEIQEENLALSGKQVAVFTASWCPPCKKFKNEEVQKLMNSGWKVGSHKNAQIRIIDIDESKEAYRRWAKETGTNKIPLFVLMDKGVMIGYKNGFHSGKQIGEWYNAN